MSTPPRVFLVGPRGSGKTTVAALLAGRLGWSWVDADVVLEQAAGRSVRDVFAAEGEAGFRAREVEVLRALCERDATVVAAGGGAVLHPDNRARMRQAGVVVWLRADADVLWDRIRADATTAQRRPPLGAGGREEVVRVLADREPLYRACAHHAVDTAGLTPAEVAALVHAAVTSLR
jgi:shikimate kinase